MSAVVRRRDPRGDPLFDRVSLLITGNTAIRDDSRAKTALTVGGSVAVRPAPKFQSGAALLYDRVGGADVVQCACPVVGTVDYCFECYVLIDALPPAVGNPNDLYMLWKASQVTPAAHEIKSNGPWSLYLQGIGYYQCPVPVPLGEPVHLATSRQSNIYRLFQNGKLLVQVAATSSYAASTSDIGGDSGVGSGRSLAGFMRDIRFTVGHPRYTKDFTPPPPGFSTFGVESRAAVVLPLPVEEPEPEPELGTESCASIVTAGLGGTVKPFMVTRGLGLCPGLQPVTPPAPQMTLYYEPERSDQTHHLRRKILREDQLLLEVIMLAVTRVLR